MLSKRGSHNLPLPDGEVYPFPAYHCEARAGRLGYGGQEELTRLNLKYDELVRSRLTDENRRPENFQLFEKTGFRLSPE